MRVGDCPSCHAPVEFLPGGGKVKVCEYCHTVVLRGEARLEQLGKVADLADTESPLSLGLRGRHGDADFTVAGRLQKENDAGTWDEWCLAFDDGRTGWLSESEGEWNLMFPVEGAALPAQKELRPLATFKVRDTAFTVEEVNQAKTRSAAGQLPDFHAEHFYADATGPRGVFCSLDYANGEQEAYVGSRTSLAALGFDAAQLNPTPRRDALTGARCTECNGPLALKAPDAARRVACPYCGALLSVEHGTLSFLELLKKPKREPRLPLGAQGTLAGTRWTVLAFLIRSCTVEGVRYEWDEYLLWERAQGFRWLMSSNGHWTFLTPIAAGEVELGFKRATWKGRAFKAYQKVRATTDFVLGECYWQVSVGERAVATEFIDPPGSINLDQTEHEVTFTYGELLAPEAVQKAFALKGALPRPHGIASAQVNPHRARAAEGFKWAALWSGLLLVLVIAFAALGHRATYFSASFSVPPGVAAGTPDLQRFSEPFEVRDPVPLEVTVSAPGLSNNWLGVSVDLVDDATGAVTAVYAEPSYYSGVEGGESWSEGSRSVSKQTHEVPAGRYVLRATPSFDRGKGVDYSVTVRADDGPGFFCPLLVFFAVLALPVYSALRASQFETQRWEDSVFQA